MLNSTRFVGLKAMADGSLLRIATLHDKPYLVVPIVSAVGDQVWWPANSPNPELVPAEVLESAYWSRNNRPIVAGHPRVNGEYVSANSPEILEKYCYGHLFAAEYDNKRIKVEAWFDKERANLVGPAATDVINRLENGEQIEISEGNYVISESKDGELDGKPYKSVWLSCVNDHLATVSKGACDNEMGCGGPRVSQISSLLVNEASKMDDKTKKDNMFRRMFASMTEALKSAMSNNELRTKLYKAVSEKEMGVDLVYDEDVEAKTFIYRICIRYGDYYDTSYEYDYKLYRRSFEISGSDVKIVDDAVEVEWFEGWREKTTSETETELTVTSSQSDKIVSQSCSCHNQEKENSTVNANEKKKDLVTRLIGSSKGFVKEEDRKIFEELSEDRLTSMIGVYEGDTVQSTTAPETTQIQTPQVVVETTGGITANTDQVVISREEYTDIKAAASAYRQQQEQYRSSIISTLKSAQSAFTEDDLKAMSTVQLEKLSQSLKIDEPVVDYSVRGVNQPRVNSSAPEMRELPNPWGISN